VFCPECGAPLIRVTAPEPALAPPAPLSEATVPIAIPNNSQPKFVLPGKVDWTYGLPAAILAGFVSAVFMLVSLGTSTLGMFVTGALAVMYYRRRTPHSDITLRMGAKLGLMAGLIAFVICTALITIVTLFSGTERLRTYLLEMAKQAPRFGSRPEVQQQWDWLMSPEGFPSLVLGYLFSALVIFLIFSAIGGLLGAGWTRLRKRH